MSRAIEQRDRCGSQSGSASHTVNNPGSKRDLALVAVTGDPTTDIAAVRRIHMVTKGGAIVLSGVVTFRSECLGGDAPAVA